MKFKGREKEYHRQYYYSRRQKLYNYLGGKCVQCESTKNLEFDHIDPSLKSFDIKKNHTIDSIKNELDKCQLLCNTCHSKKTAKENTGITHGSVYAWMKAKCKCEECTSARSKYNQERNLKRRKSSNSNGKIKDQTHCKNGHELNDKNLSIQTRKSGYITYTCKVCHREKEALRRKS